LYKKILRKLAVIPYVAKQEQDRVWWIFSPERLVTEVRRKGGSGKAYDIVYSDDFRKRDCRHETRRELALAEPDEVISTPPCDQCSRMQNLTPDWKRNEDQRQQRRGKLAFAIVLLKFGILVVLDQLVRGGRTLFEHPLGADS
jgi:hypothetical protein